MNCHKTRSAAPTLISLLVSIFLLAACEESSPSFGSAKRKGKKKSKKISAVSNSKARSRSGGSFGGGGSSTQSQAAKDLSQCPVGTRRTLGLTGGRYEIEVLKYDGVYCHFATTFPSGDRRNCHHSVRDHGSFLKVKFEDMLETLKHNC